MTNRYVHRSTSGKITLVNYPTNIPNLNKIHKIVRKLLKSIVSIHRIRI